jgi:hypothetical protein
VPGPVYTLSDVAFEGFPEDLAAQMKNLWKIPRGTAVDFPYASSFVTRFSARDQATSSRFAGAKVSYLLIADPKAHTVRITYRLGQ